MIDIIEYLDFSQRSLRQVNQSGIMCYSANNNQPEAVDGFYIPAIIFQR
jgi:hypothetical protein